MKIELQIIITILGLIISWIISGVIIEFLFGKKDEIKYIDIRDIPKEGEIVFTRKFINH